MKNKVACAVSLFSFLVFISSLFCLAISRENSAYASFITAKIASPVKNGLLVLSNFVPFSLFEFLCVLSPAILFFLIYFIYKKRKRIFCAFLHVLSVFFIVFSLLIVTVFLSYGIDIGYQSNELCASDLAASLEYLNAKIDSSGEPLYPEWSELSQILYSSYKNLSLPETHLTTVCPKVKLIKYNGLASRLGILGSYSFLTGEININPSAPKYTAVFSVAHEMAHLFGIAGEAEASFYAYLALVESNNESLSYSAALSAAEYLLSDAFHLDKELFLEYYQSLSERAKRDLSEYRLFYYGNQSKISDYSESANTALLDFADSNGGNDYGAFSTLFVSYLLNEKL